MAFIPKKRKAVNGKVDANKAYSLKDASALVKEVNTTKFDASVDLHIRLGVDPKKADQAIRGTVTLPHGTGKTQTVIVFAKGDAAKAAEEAGADFVGDSDLVEKVQSGWLDFDVVVAAPDMMAEVGKLGRVLGPKGLMPNPKTGTVTPDVAKAVNDIKAGQVTYRVDRQSNVHVPIGKVSFDTDKLKENLAALHDVIVKAKPASSKGVYIKNMAVASTFGPGVKVDNSTVLK